MVLMVIYRGGGGGGGGGRRRSRHRGCRSSLVNGEMNARADRYYIYIIIRCRKYTASGGGGGGGGEEASFSRLHKKHTR